MPNGLWEANEHNESPAGRWQSGGEGRERWSTSALPEPSTQQGKGALGAQMGLGALRWVVTGLLPSGPQALPGLRASGFSSIHLDTGLLSGVD